MTVSEKNIINALNKGYIIDSFGNVFSKKCRKVKLYLKNKYLAFSVKNEGKNTIIYTHRFQGYKKFGNKIFTEGLEIRHLNGDCCDNSFNNLELGTRSENQFDKSDDMRLKQSLHATSHVKIHNHKDIIRDYLNGLSYRDLMMKYNISSKGTISYIIKKSYDSK